jgi:hypothetical protein
MFVTKKSLPRRTFLRGAGAVVALPLLESMVPAFTAVGRTAASPQRRVGFVYVPNGVILESWTPSQTGAGFAMTPILSPLEPFRDRLTVLSNLTRPGGDERNDHTVSQAGWLSGVVAKRTEAEDIFLGPTIDQIVARQIGQDTPFPSIEVATENFTGYIGACTPGYSCAYSNTLSWADETTPLPMEINPRIVFERMFGGPGTQAQRRAALAEDRSILDSIKEDLGDLRRGLGRQDQTRVGEYLDNVREIERRIQRTEAQSERQSVSIDAPVGLPDAYGDHVGLLFDLLAVAYQTDLTRVFTFMMAREASNISYPQIGVTEPHHLLSHHGGKPDKIAEHAKINVYHVQLFANFIEKLRTTPDGDGSLLDHSLIFYGSGMGNGNAHAGYPLPLVAVGVGVGRGNRHVACAERTPLSNLWLGVANTFGNSMSRFGDSAGQLEL